MSDIKLRRLEDAIHETQNKIGKVGEMRPGSLSKQVRKSGEKYGEYWHLSYTHQGKGRTQYIREACLAQVKSEVANFKSFKKLVDRLITLSIERSQLRIKMEKNGASGEARTR
jgi:hypothetical protein